MDCREVRSQLSEYSDGMLTKAGAARVKDHLAGCPDCATAYATMLKIIEHMGQMEGIEEPADFLEKVNARLDRRFSWRTWMRRLFVPLRIKLPLELAAAAAAITLVVYLAGIRDARDVYEITISLQGSEKTELESIMDKAEIAAQPAPTESFGDAALPLKEQNEAQDKPAEQKRADYFGPATVPPATIPPAVDKPVPVAGESEEKKGEGRADEQPAEAVQTIADRAQPAEPAQPAPATQEVRQKKSARGADAAGDREKVAEPAPAQVEQLERSPVQTQPPKPVSEPVSAPFSKSVLGTSPNRMRYMSRMKEPSVETIVRSFGGKVIEKESDAGTADLIYMIVEIQADSYEPLLESLRRIAVIKDSPKVEKTEGDKLIRVKITFQQDPHSRR